MASWSRSRADGHFLNYVSSRAGRVGKLQCLRAIVAARGPPGVAKFRDGVLQIQAAAEFPAGLKFRPGADAARNQAFVMLWITWSCAPARAPPAVALECELKTDNPCGLPRGPLDQ